MGSTKDFYEVLNIPRDSNTEEIRRAYKDLVKKWHPDKHPPSTKLLAAARFKAITQAYEALHDQKSMFDVYADAAAASGRSRGSSSSAPSSPSHRARMSEYQEYSLPKTPRTPGRDFKDMYFSSQAAPGTPTRRDQLLKDGYSSSPRFSERRKPPPVEKKLECTLEELSRGCNKEIKFTRDVVAKDGSIVQKEEVQTIRVKPGWKKGTKITFEGMGDERKGCLPADVVFLVSEKDHPVFKRVGNDLVLKVEIPLLNALTGWTFSFRLLSGDKMSCSFHDDIVYPGYEKVIEGQGMPVAGEKWLRGDLRIKFNIVFPKKLSEGQRASIREFLKDTT